VLLDICKRIAIATVDIVDIVDIVDTLLRFHWHGFARMVSLFCLFFYMHIALFANRSVKGSGSHRYILACFLHR
jgi:hypothetical protein